MNYQRILEGILDIGEAMLCSGAENFRLDDTLYRMCKSYGFKRYDVFVIPSNIQITVETPEGEFLTQIRHIESAGINYDRLDYLNNLARYVCRHTPDEETLREKYLEVMNRKQQPVALTYAAGIMGGTGFAVFFGCGLTDAVVAVLVSLLIVFVGRVLDKVEDWLVFDFPTVMINTRTGEVRERPALPENYWNGSGHQPRIYVNLGDTLLVDCRYEPYTRVDIGPDGTPATLVTSRGFLGLISSEDFLNGMPNYTEVGPYIG